MDDILKFFDDGFGLERTPGLYSYHDSRTKDSGKTYHSYDRDGAVIQYAGAHHKENYALSLNNQYLPFAEDADELTHESQVTGVFSYPTENINEAFWNESVDASKLRPLWRKDCKALRSYIESLNEKIKELQAKEKRYRSMLPEVTTVSKDARLDAKGA